MATNRQLDAMVLQGAARIESTLSANLVHPGSAPSTRTPQQRADAIVEAILGAGREIAAAMDADLARERAAQRAKIDAAVLPECEGFTGTGQRCGKCRIHKNIHN